MNTRADTIDCSRQALKKYVLANNNLGGVTDAQFTTQFNRALTRGSETGVFTRPKGTLHRNAQQHQSDMHATRLSRPSTLSVATAFEILEHSR